MVLPVLLGLAHAVTDRPEAVPPASAAAQREEQSGPRLLVPVAGVAPHELTRQFDEPRSGGRLHQAIDILAPRNTPVLAADDGTIARLMQNELGGLTVYQLDPTERFAYYYAHLEAYAEGLVEGAPVRRGELIGYVGTSGNAPQSTPHLHFAVLRLTDRRRWWEGAPIDPYDLLVESRLAER